MEVKIGIQHAPRELVVDTEDDAAAVEKQFTEAVAGDGVLALTDTKGRRVIVPADRISYVEIGTGTPGTSASVPEPGRASCVDDTPAGSGVVTARKESPCSAPSCGHWSPAPSSGSSARWSLPVTATTSRCG